MGMGYVGILLLEKKNIYRYIYIFIKLSGLRFR